MQFRARQCYASASIRLTKLKLSASIYARPKLWADASMVDTGTVYTRKTGSDVFLAISYPRRRTTRSDTQTTMLIQVHLRTRGEGDLAHGERCGMAQYEYKLYNLHLCLGTVRHSVLSIHLLRAVPMWMGGDLVFA